ncbi:YitT family protein [Bacillus suaedaesalsae]|uniref:YitT family protein n=1 Tax=Bacillus suaedaesalsae TaxID=2810349 RepID=A0ABS2DMS6_9BACI|nr:YitT family protein [Bacillus suaedaesalsae]MBM6619810.1 YitT family protein [Bacillus suaedaesalsae]
MNERICAVTIGSLLIGIGINAFIMPHHLMEGGMIGIGLIAKYKWGLEPGLTIIILSIPIYIFTFLYNKTLFFRSIHGLLLSSFFIDMLSPLRSTFSLPMISSAALGGALIGVGIGLMLRYQTSTGGLDLLAQALSIAFLMNVGVIIFLFDFSIILAGSLLIESTSLLFSLIAVCFVAIFTTLCTYSYIK